MHICRTTSWTGYTFQIVTPYFILSVDGLTRLVHCLQPGDMLINGLSGGLGSVTEVINSHLGLPHKPEIFCHPLLGGCVIVRICGQSFIDVMSPANSNNNACLLSSEMILIARR